MLLTVSLCQLGLKSRNKMGIIVRFVRHGEMALNRPENYNNIIKTGVDGSLTKRGIAEAEVLGKSLSNIKFDRVYSSDFKRARETAEIVLKHSQKPVPEITTDLRVRERDSGDWENKTPMDMIQAAMQQQVYPHFLPCNGGETVEQVTQRAAAFFNDLCKISDETENEESVLVTTHGAWLATFLEYLIVSPELYKLENCDVSVARKPAGTTAVTQISIGKPVSNVRRLNFVQLNDQKHLENQVLPD